MPKIIINEYDKTNTPIADYANFTVLVPGFADDPDVTDETGKKIFDDNGIYECSSQEDFVKYVTKIPAGVLDRPAIPAEPIVMNGSLGTNRIDRYLNWDITDINAYMQLVEQYGSNSIYTAECVGGVGKIGDTGTVISDEDERDEALAEIHSEALEISIKDSVTITTEEGTTTSYFGQVYRFKKITDAASALSAGVPLAVIPTGKEGSAARHIAGGEGGCQYGNQIAFELLGMGYTVLYKVITEEFITELKDYANFWYPLVDKGTYDFRYIMSGLISVSNPADMLVINNNMCKLAHWQNNNKSSSNGRGDCIALVDIDSAAYTGKTNVMAIASMKNYVANLTEADKNTAVFAPYVIYSLVDEDYGNNTFPASFHYLACAARSINELNFNEWYAISGFTRGLSKYSIIGTGIKLGEIAANALQLRQAEDGYNKAINLIVKIRGNYYLWGNRTAAILESDADANLKASHFLNIRQLCCSLKKQIYLACRKFTFDPNSDVLWHNFVGAIEPTLKKMQSDQGISNYQFIKCASKERATLTAIIRIVPIEAVEDFVINVTLEDSIDGAAITVSEE